MKPINIVWVFGVAMLGGSCSRETPKPAPALPPQSSVSTQEHHVALARGRKITAQAFGLLSTNLLRAIEQHGVSNALPYCSAQAIPLTSLVARTNGVSLRRVSHRARNPANRAADVEQALLSQLQADLSAGIPLQPTVVGTGPDTVTFYAPIVITNALCLKCHGQPENDVALEDLVTIRRLYPADAATGFKLGDLRGLWRVDFQRSALASLGEEPPRHGAPTDGANPGSGDPSTEMVHVPAGEFEMGDAHGTGYRDERPVRRVFVSEFCVATTEVTQAQWDDVADWAKTNGYAFEGFERCPRNKPTHPICNVSWHDAIKWANARSEKEGRTPVYHLDTEQREIYRRGLTKVPAHGVKWSANGYRLPTEAEWEKAARGGLSGHQYPWPSNGPEFTRFFDGSKANFWQSGDPFESDADCATSPVGYFDGRQTPAGADMTNGFGLYDTAGNAFEWCWDLYHDTWYGQPEAARPDPRGPATGFGRVLRGGSWISSDQYCRVAARYVSEPSYHCHCYGFRLVVSGSGWPTRKTAPSPRRRRTPG